MSDKTGLSRGQAVAANRVGRFALSLLLDDDMPEAEVTAALLATAWAIITVAYPHDRAKARWRAMTESVLAEQGGEA